MNVQDELKNIISNVNEISAKGCDEQGYGMSVNIAATLSRYMLNTTQNFFDKKTKGLAEGEAIEFTGTDIHGLKYQVFVLDELIEEYVTLRRNLKRTLSNMETIEAQKDNLAVPPDQL